ncbi:MAG: phage tail protein [Oscillospiraceae bacterium]
MPYVVDFENVSDTGLEASPLREALAGLRANEARYYRNKYGHEFSVLPAGETPETLAYVNRILKEERGLVLAATPLETSSFQVENIKMVYVFYQNGLAVNVMYTIDDPKKRAVGFKLAEGMEVPAELEGKFKFARQKSKLAGTIRGSFFVIKGEY